MRFNLGRACVPHHVLICDVSIRETPNWIPGVIVAATSAALCGSLTDARDLADQLRKLDPNLCLSNLRERLPFQRDEYVAAYRDGLRKAGLPD